MNNIEEWKVVIGFENYMVSNYGNLKRIYKKGEQLLSTSNLDKDGYIKTSMNKDGKRYHLRMHRIVAENFIPNPENLPIVNHKNGVKSDNRCDNLEWCTISYNTKHGFDVMGRKGQNGGMNTPVVLRYDNGEFIKFNSQRDCAKFIKRSETTVGKYIKEPRLSEKYKYTIVRDCEGVTTNESVF